MSLLGSEYRLDGIYRQRQDGFFLLRVKLVVGVISAAQARAVATTSARFGQGNIHLTSRGNIEIHWLREADLLAIKKAMTAVGLTSRGACGGAVRGVTCASQGAQGFPAVENMALRIHRYFTGNPRFERLPKKFKIGIEADFSSRRHLIQDVGLVLTGSQDNVSYFDMYVAGGLGREPQPGFLFETSINENMVIPLIEAVTRVYSANASAGKRLKHLIIEIGVDEFRRLVQLEPTFGEELPAVNGLPESIIETSDRNQLTVNIPAGELSSNQLIALSDFADRWSNGFFMVTPDQNIAFHLDEKVNREEASKELKHDGFSTSGVTFRVCPGSTTCLVGLSPTREIAEKLVNLMGEKAVSLDWAISGCPNSCTQPQLADIGIVSSKLVKEEDGGRLPYFDLYRSVNGPLGNIVARSLSLDQLCSIVREIG